MGRLRSRWLQRKVDSLEPGLLAGYYQARFPEPGSAWDEVRYVVLDVETTGLDPEHDALLSLGWVVVEQGRIVASSGRHHLVSPPDGTDMGQSPTLHGITDHDVRSAPEAGPIVEALLNDLVDSAGAGAVLVCHFAQLEVGFLDCLVTQDPDRFGAGAWFRPRLLIDTMAWHLDRARRLHPTPEPDPEAVRLYSLLARYRLPPVRPHHALSDAFGTALLLCAMAERSGEPDRPTRLEDLLDSRSW